MTCQSCDGSNVTPRQSTPASLPVSKDRCGMLLHFLITVPEFLLRFFSTLQLNGEYNDASR